MVMDRSEIPITAHNILERKVIDELFKKLEAAELRETYTTISMKELADSVLTGDKLLRKAESTIKAISELTVHMCIHTNDVGKVTVPDKYICYYELTALLKEQC